MITGRSAKRGQAVDEAIDTVLKFERAINARDPEQICALITDDAAFIDSLGASITGAGKWRAAWEGYFRMVPDYAISHSDIIPGGDTVAIFGSAQGTFSKAGALRSEDFWRMPAAWRAVVRQGRIAVWQVYADNEPLRAIMRKYSQR